MMDSHLSFTITRKNLTDRILIPKFYDPDLESANRRATPMFDLPALSDLLLPGKAGSQLGSWLPRENYGSGSIPFVRTSDLFHWRIRPDFKMGVSEAVYKQYGPRSDVKASDLLFVAHGSYLIGDVAMVGAEDVPVLLQDHVFRLRLNPDAGVSPQLLLAALSTRFVRRQVRARQFSAEIIDKIGERHLGIRVPIPKGADQRAAVVRSVETVMEKHKEVRATIARTATIQRAPGPRAASHLGFQKRISELVSRVLIPRYYDPELDADLHAAEEADGTPWVSLGSLAERGLVSISAGVEVGKMAYGTGAIPFVRTSDLVDWELYRDPTQGVSEQVYAEYKAKGALAVEDIVVVRDGTYLVGSSALVLDADLPALFCGGICRLRVRDKTMLNSHALLGLLNLPLVRRQMRARQFSRDVIDTLGKRLLEVKVPAPGSATSRQMELHVRDVMTKKGEIKALMTEAIGRLEPSIPASTVGRPGWSMR